MAVSDTLTGLLPLPHFIHFYTGGRYTDWVPYSWCVTYTALTEHLPTGFHTTSIWLTVALAVQRSVSVTIFVCLTLSLPDTFAATVTVIKR